MSKPWGIGDWAADVEREEREQAAAAATATAGGGSQSFPSLRDAVTAKPKKKKMTLTEFYSETSSGGSAARPKGLTPDEMFLLPTGPKQRSAEEMEQGRLGGGFNNYGRGGPRGREDGGEGGGRRQYGGFDDERRGPSSRASDYDLPSRADEVDNWATGKKTMPSADLGRPGARYGSLGGGGGGGFGGGSRSDEVDNWAVGKKSAQAPAPSRSSTFGSGFRDTSGPEADRWSRGGGGGFGGGGGGGDIEPVKDRPRLVLDPRKGGLVGDSEPVRTNKPSPFGAARPREEVLAEKGLDWKKLDVEIETKKSISQSSRPTSAHSSRPSSAHSNRSEGVQQGSLENVVSKPKPKVNPFGEAKPREVLLQERGQDWRKIDLELEHRRVERPETEEEKSLKEEINHLKQDLQKEAAPKEGTESAEVSGGTQLLETIAEKEKQLETLIRDLDDKVRFGPKVFARPGSGAGRSAGFPERPPSQSGSVDEPRSMEFVDRPRSRGRSETWSRPSDERRSFHGSQDREFLGSREFDRPRSRGRW